MRKGILFLICFCLAFSCKESLYQQNSKIRLAQTIVSTKSILIDGATKVSMKDMEAYTHFKYLDCKKTAKNVDPISDGEDTLFFIVNYQEGWELIAADKRAPVVLASGESGSFSMNSDNQEMLSWICCLAADVKELKQKEDYSSCSDEELERMLYSRKFWGLVCCEPNYIQEPLTRGHDDTLDLFLNGGHYELVGVSHGTELYDDVRLTQTQWSQNAPYNYYCPFKTIIDDDPRAPAGCVAVAGAQMLYYLHNEISVPVNAPDTAYCVGYIGGDAYFFGGISDSTWNYMLNNSINYKNCYSAAVLIMCVGRLVGMEYGNNGSGALTADLVDNVFNPFGIDCTYGSFNTSTVSQSLINGMPIIVRADGICNTFLGIAISYDHRHSFIIDGYRRYRATHNYQYEWVWDDPPAGPPIPYIRPTSVISYGSPYITDYRMNWGWGGDNNDDYFSPSGNWSIDEDNFVYRREMIYNFSAIN